MHALKHSMQKEACYDEQDRNNMLVKHVRVSKGCMGFKWHCFFDADTYEASTSAGTHTLDC